MMHDNLPPLVLLAGLVDGVHWILVILFYFIYSGLGAKHRILSPSKLY